MIGAGAALARTIGARASSCVAGYPDGPDLVLYGLVQSYVLGLVIGRAHRLRSTRAPAPRGHGLLSGWPLALQVGVLRGHTRPVHLRLPPPAAPQPLPVAAARGPPLGDPGRLALRIALAPAGDPDQPDDRVRADRSCSAPPPRCPCSRARSARSGGCSSTPTSTSGSARFSTWSTAPRCTAGTTRARTSATARTTAPSSRCGTGCSAPRTCRPRSPTATGSPIRSRPRSSWRSRPPRSGAALRPAAPLVPLAHVHEREVAARRGSHAPCCGGAAPRAAAPASGAPPRPASRVPGSAARGSRPPTTRRPVHATPPRPAPPAPPCVSTISLPVAAPPDARARMCASGVSPSGAPRMPRGVPRSRRSFITSPRRRGAPARSRRR